MGKNILPSLKWEAQCKLQINRAGYLGSSSAIASKARVRPQAFINWRAGTCGLIHHRFRFISGRRARRRILLLRLRRTPCSTLGNPRLVARSRFHVCHKLEPISTMNIVLAENRTIAEHCMNCIWPIRHWQHGSLPRFTILLVRITNRK